MREKKTASNRKQDYHSDDRDELNELNEMMELMEALTALSIPKYSTSDELTFVWANSG
jgi:hypothetical protein